MSDLDIVIHGEGLRRMRWNSEPVERLLIQANLIGEHMAEWADWNNDTGILTLVGTNGIAKYEYTGETVPEGHLVFYRRDWLPIQTTKHGPFCMSLGNNNCDCKETERQPAFASCELHEVSNCSVCSGLDKKLAKEDAPVDLETLGSPPPGYTWAQWPGKCAGCGQDFDRGEPIRYSKTSEGFVGNGCC